MSTKVNKAGEDWLVMKGYINTQISEAHRNMERALSPEDYHAERGAILAMRKLLEWVEPTTPPQTTEETYGISDPNSENYA